jgi:hypothetical protein
LVCDSIKDKVDQSLTAENIILKKEDEMDDNEVVKKYDDPTDSDEDSEDEYEKYFQINLDLKNVITLKLPTNDDNPNCTFVTYTTEIKTLQDIKAKVNHLKDDYMFIFNHKLVSDGDITHLIQRDQSTKQQTMYVSTKMSKERESNFLVKPEDKWLLVELKAWINNYEVTNRPEAVEQLKTEITGNIIDKKWSDWEAVLALLGKLN